MSLTSKTIVAASGIGLVLSSMAISTSAQAMANPPCTKAAVTPALEAQGIDVTYTYKPTCKKKNGKSWAAVSFTIDDMDDAAALLKAKNGKWKRVSEKREAKLCGLNNNKLPKKIKKRACVS